MTIKAQCPGCGRVYTLDESKAGRLVKCKDCHETIEVPSLKGMSPSRPKPRPPASPKPAKKPRPEKDEEEEYGDLPPRINTGEPRRSTKKRRSSGSGFRIKFNWGLIVKTVLLLMFVLCAGGGVLVIVQVPKVRRAAWIAAEQKTKWSTFTFPDGKFSCEMPEGTAYSQKLGMSGLTSRVWEKSYGRLAVSVGFSDSSSIPDWQNNPVGNMAKAQQVMPEMLKSKSHTIVSANTTTIQGYPACEFVTKIKDGTMWMVMIHANSRLIILSCVYPTNDEPPDAKRILKTLVIE